MAERLGCEMVAYITHSGTPGLQHDDQMVPGRPWDCPTSMLEGLSRMRSEVCPDEPYA